MAPSPKWLATALLLLTGSTFSAQRAPSVGPDAARALADASTAPAAAPRAGTIEGVVTRNPRPARRVANRYPAGAAGAHALQEVPVIAYIEGVAPGSAPRAPAATEIAQRDTAFLPSLLVVPVGTTVTFPNADPIFHNVFSYSPTQRFDLGRYPRGESKSILFDKPGTVKIYCEVHDYMRAAVIVVQNPFHAVVGADGRFTIPNVPAGTYRLVIWHVELSPQELAVTVPENGVARVQATLD
jgi:plastocyanin